MKQVKSRWLFVALLATSTLPVFGQEIEQQIIDKIKRAYGGDALTSLKTITVSDHNKDLWPGETEVPAMPDFWINNEELSIDFSQQRKSMLSWRDNRTSQDLEKLVFDGKNGWFYDLLNHKYSQDDWYNYSNIGSVISVRSDVLVAKYLAEQSAAIDAVGDEFFRGELHQKIKAKLQNKNDYTIYVNKTSGLISKITRQHPKAGELSYVFSNHAAVDGITFARDLNYFVNQTPRLISTYRNIEVNPKLDHNFVKPTGFTVWGKSFDTSTVTANVMAKGVYHVGKRRSHTLFVEADDHFLAIGGESELTTNFQQVQGLAGSNKPLKYVVITHHHPRSIAIAKEALSLGAKLVVPEHALAVIESSTGKQIKAEERIVFSKTLVMAGGKLEVHDIATAHARQHLFAYLPQEKILFGEHIFDTDLQTDLPRVHKDMAIFATKLNSMNIDYLVSSVSPRQLSWQDFISAVSAFDEITCPAEYSVCRS